MKSKKIKYKSEWWTVLSADHDDDQRMQEQVEVARGNALTVKTWANRKGLSARLLWTEIKFRLKIVQETRNEMMNALNFTSWYIQTKLNY